MFHSVKFIKNFRNFILFDADALVTHRGFHIINMVDRGNADAATIRGIFDGIGEEVGEDFLQAPPISQDRGQILGQ